MVAEFLDQNNRELRQRRRQRERQTSNKFRKHDYDDKLPNFTRPLYKHVNTSPFLLAFSKLKYGHFGFDKLIESNQDL